MPPDVPLDVTAPDLLREAVPADLPRLRALQSCLRTPQPALLDLAVRDGPGNNGPFVLVTESDPSEVTGPDEPSESVVGYLLAVPDNPDVADPPPDGSPCLYVAELVVAPGYRRDGRGSGLLDAVEDVCPNRYHIRLTARSDDERALAFYRANGFRVLDDLPGYYEDGDGVVLVRGRNGSARNCSG